jgi:hypothetical protein
MIFNSEAYVCNQLSQVVEHVKILFETHVTYNHNLRKFHSNEPMFFCHLKQMQEIQCYLYCNK